MTFASEVSILDIGLGGVALRADKRLNIGGRYLLKLEVNKSLVSVNCEVAWARMTGTKKTGSEVVPIYTAGMKFVGVSPEHMLQLRSFVEAIGDQGRAREDERRQVREVPGQGARDRAPELPGRLRRPHHQPERHAHRERRAGGRRQPDPDGPVAPGWPAHRLRRPDRVLPAEGRGRPGTLHIGIEFIELTDPGQEALAAFIASLSAGGASNPS